MWRASATLAFDLSLRGLPPTFPLALAAANPALVRSRIRSRSNSASAPIRWKISFPEGVVVSICSVRLMNEMSRSLSLLSSSIKCLRERPARSSFHTTSVSPGLRYARASFRPLRSAFVPVIFSRNHFSQPAFLSASICNASCCSCLETRISARGPGSPPSCSSHLLLARKTKVHHQQDCSSATRNSPVELSRCMYRA